MCFYTELLRSSSRPQTSWQQPRVHFLVPQHRFLTGRLKPGHKIPTAVSTGKRKAPPHAVQHQFPALIGTAQSWLMFDLMLTEIPWAVLAGLFLTQLSSGCADRSDHLIPSVILWAFCWASWGMCWLTLCPDTLSGFRGRLFDSLWMMHRRKTKILRRFNNKLLLANFRKWR